jgi:hypothetical protein
MTLVRQLDLLGIGVFAVLRDRFPTDASPR